MAPVEVEALRGERLEVGLLTVDLDVHDLPHEEGLVDHLPVYAGLVEVALAGGFEHSAVGRLGLVEYLEVVPLVATYVPDLLEHLVVAYRDDVAVADAGGYRVALYGRALGRDPRGWELEDPVEVLCLRHRVTPPLPRMVPRRVRRARRPGPWTKAPDGP